MIEHFTRLIHADPFFVVANVRLVIAAPSNIRVTSKIPAAGKDWSGCNPPGEGGSLCYKWDLHLEGEQQLERVESSKALNFPINQLNISVSDRAFNTGFTGITASLSAKRDCLGWT